MLRSAPLVTLVGPGGVGKTRLAARMASQVVRVFRDGVVWVDLAAQHDPESLPGEIAGALGLDTRGQSVEDAVASYLEARELLLVIDNCEHLVDAIAAFVSRLLARAGSLRVLATSRQPLAVAGEHLLTVPPLPVPSPEDVSHGPIGHVEAVALLVDRASGVDRGFQVDSTNAELVARLCRRLDGVPLAIELAAARLRVLSLRQLVERLDDRFGLLSSGPREVEARHQTLRGLIDWSYELCSAEEQVLWARMSVFEGGADVDAVEAVCADPGVAVFDALAGLVDKSVLVPEEAVGRVRYRMLESIRDYGSDQLAARNEISWMQNRHRLYFVELARTADLSAFGPQRRSMFATIAAELPNLRAAHDRSLSSPDTHLDGVTLSSSIWWYWVADGALDEGLRWADRTLSARLDPTADSLHALGRAAWLSVFSGDLPRARSYAERALALRVADDSDMIHFRLCSMEALIEFVDGDLDRAIELEREPLDRALHGDRFGAEVAVGILLRSSVVRAWSGRSEEALADIELAVQLCEEYDDEWQGGQLLSLKGACLCDLGRYPEALEAAQQALHLARGFNTMEVVNGIETTAQASAMMGREAEAAVLFGAASTLRPGAGSSLLTGDQSRLASGQQRACDVLGEAGYAAAFERGRAMSLDEAVSFGLGEPAVSKVRIEQGSDALLPQLSRRELEVAELIARGLSNKDISEKLVISPRTAEGHVARLLDKLGFTGRARVAAWVAEQRALGTTPSLGAQMSSRLP